MKKTDNGHSNSTTTTPEKHLPLPAAALPLLADTKENTVEENAVKTGTEEIQQAVSNKVTAKGSTYDTGSKGQQPAQPNPQPIHWSADEPPQPAAHPTITNHPELTTETLLSKSTPKTNIPPDETITKVLVGNIPEDKTRLNTAPWSTYNTLPPEKRKNRINF